MPHQIVPASQQCCGAALFSAAPIPGLPVLAVPTTDTATNLKKETNLKDLIIFSYKIFYHPEGKIK